MANKIHVDIVSAEHEIYSGEAEMVFAPTWGNTRPDKDGKVDGESTFRVRARGAAFHAAPAAIFRPANARKRPTAVA